MEDRPGVAANIFEPLVTKWMWHGYSKHIFWSKTTDITFTVKDDITKTKQVLKNNNEIKYKEIIQNEKVAKISIVGAGMVSTGVSLECLELYPMKISKF